MGEIAEMMLEGILCEGCGELMGDMVDGSTLPGHPRRCRGCHPINLAYAMKRPTWEKTPAAKRAAKHNRERHERAREAGKKFGCDKCSKLCRTPEGLAQHKIDKHVPSGKVGRRDMKPFMMKFRQGKGAAEREVHVNMKQVCYITTDGATGSVLTFGAIIGEEPAYLCVNEAPDEIGKRPEWKS